MKKVFSIIALSLMMSTTVSAENVSATIHADQGKYKINKEIYGQFSEHLGSCIYGGLCGHQHWFHDGRKLYQHLPRKVRHDTT